MQIPRLYKYREFIETETIRIGSQNREKIPRWQQVLYDGVLFLSPPDSFNDPYDCDFVVDSSFLNEPAAREICYKSLLQMQTLSDEEKQEIHKNRQKIINTRSLRDALETALHAEVSTDIEAMLMRMVNESLQKLKREFRVLCFSELNDSILMWSHYAHNHAGFCIEYDFNRGDLKNLLKPVQYSKNRHCIAGGFANKDSVTANAEIYNATLHKSDVWEYEKEWRLVDRPTQLSVILGERGKYVINLANYITGVYLGAKVSEVHKEQICNHFKGTNVKVYQMQMQTDSYTLVPTLIK